MRYSIADIGVLVNLHLLCGVICTKAYFANNSIPFNTLQSIQKAAQMSSPMVIIKNFEERLYPPLVLFLLELNYIINWCGASVSILTLTSL